MMDQVNRETLDFALQQGTDHLLSEQADDGYWWGELESNVTMAAEHILLERFLGSYDTERESRIRQYILSLQKEDGSGSYAETTRCFLQAAKQVVVAFLKS